MKRWIEDKKEIRTLEKWEASWLAGVIDGEGSLGLYNYGKEGRRVQIQMANTSEEYCQRMRDIIGAGSTVLRVNMSASHKGRKPLYYYSLKGSNRCYKVLKQLIPFLIIKKDKAVAIIEELELKPFGRWANASEESRNKSAALARARWTNIKFREKTIQKMRDFYKNNENLLKHQERMKKVWQDKNVLS